jgi:hypothetical protein
VDDSHRALRDAVPVDDRADRWQPPLTQLLYGHVVVTTLVHCVVVVAALALTSMAPWAAGALLASTLALAAHAAHVRRNGQRLTGHLRPTKGFDTDTETDTGHRR